MTDGRGLQLELLGGSESLAQPGAQLTKWQPEQWQVSPDWRETVDHFLDSSKGQDLARFMTQRLNDGATIYPEQPLRALDLTPLASVKVVILGQDPYHGPGQAEGLAFSVTAGMKVPPSLRNIFKELAWEAEQATPGAESLLKPRDGSLLPWARQGVLLLNACLTVERGLPASHANHGWEALTDAVVRAVLANGRMVVFLLWGAHAQKLADCVTSAPGSHRVLMANHPSPLSAMRPPQPFIGCGHFAKANALLVESGQLPIIW
jgi:uracil-DNA glycosylase